jgi:hypothetical protein
LVSVLRNIIILYSSIPSNVGGFSVVLPASNEFG